MFLVPSKHKINAAYATYHAEFIFSTGFCCLLALRELSLSAQTQLSASTVFANKRWRYPYRTAAIAAPVSA